MNLSDLRASFQPIAHNVVHAGAAAKKAVEAGTATLAILTAVAAIAPISIPAGAAALLTGSAVGICALLTREENTPSMQAANTVAPPQQMMPLPAPVMI